MNRRRIVQLSAMALAAPTLARAAPPKPLRILILGGTGFIGPHQVRYALSRGHKVTVFNRGRHPQGWPGPVEELTGDRNASDLKALAGRRWDVCIDNPTTLPFWVRDAGQVLAGKVGHYIFISTISVYAANDTPGADETAPVQPYTGADPSAETASSNALYGPLKAASEREAHRQFGDAVTIIRPGLIVGPGDETDRFTYWPVRLANPAKAWGPEIAAPGDGADPVQLIDARDLAEWTIRMAETRTPGVFNAAGPARPMTMRAMLTGIAKGVAAQPQVGWIPATVLGAQKINAWSDMPVWIPGQGDTAGFHRRSLDRAQAAGLTYRPLPLTAADTLEWFMKQPADRQAKLKAGLTPEREAALLVAWKGGD